VENAKVFIEGLLEKKTFNVCRFEINQKGENYPVGKLRNCISLSSIVKIV
jgi:hypothetical protein